MKKLVKLIAALGLAAAAAVPAQAALVNSISGALVQTFDDAASYDTSGASVQIGAAIGLNVTVAGAGGAIYFGPPAGAWSLGSNGEWTSAKTFVGVDGDYQDRSNDIAASMNFSIGSSRVRAVGAELNFDPDFVYGGGSPLPLYLAAYDFGGNLIEDHFVSIFTPSGINEGLFFGISTDTDIARFEVSGPYAVVDSLSFRVPEPSTMLLLPLALAGLALRRKVA